MSTEQAPVIDASRVPVYPVARLAAIKWGEEWRGVVDGDVVAVGPEETVKEAVLARAAELAAQRPGGAIRVVTQGMDPAEGGVVTSAGEVLPMVAQPPVVSRRRFWVLLVAVVAAVAVAAAGLAAVWTLRGERSAPPAAAATPAPTATQLPVVAPPGWSSVAAWSWPVASTSAAVTVAAGQVFLPSEGSAGVVAVDAATGQRRWEASIGGGVLGGQLSGGPVVVGSGDAAVVAAWTSGRLMAWSTSGQEVGSWPLSSSMSQVRPVTGGLVVSGAGQHVAAFTGHALVSRVLPAGATAVAVSGSGEVTATAPGRVWVVTSDSVAGAGAALTSPAGRQWAGVVGMAAGRLLVAYSTSVGSAVVVRAFAGSRDWAPSWTSSEIPAGQYVGSSSTSGLAASAAGTWGIFGSSLLDLTSGRATALPQGWVTSAVGSSRAFGTVGGVVGSVSASGVVSMPETSPSTSGAPVAPAAVTDEGAAIIVAADGPDSAVYAVPAVGEGSR